MAAVFVAGEAGCAGRRARARERELAQSRATASASVGARVVGWLPADSRAALVILPVGEGDGAPPATVRVEAGDHVEDAAPVWWLAPSAVAGASGVVEEGGAVGEEPGPGRMRAWLGGAVAWTAAPLSPTSSIPKGAPGVALVGLPAAAGVTSTPIRINGTPADIRWLAPSSGRLDLGPPAHPAAADGANSWLLASLRIAATQPWTCWRARLAAPGARISEAGSSATDSVAARLGEQRAEVWEVALQRLARSDRETARRLATMLGGVVDFGGGVLAPVWTEWPGPGAPDDGLSLLLADLLADDLSGAERAARTRAWIEHLPAGAAWVMDDAGLREATSKAGIATLAMVNLTDAPAAASVSIDGAGTPVEMLTIKPMSAATVRVAVRPREGGGVRVESPARGLALRIGEWRGRETVLSQAVAARPPGVPIGPLVRDLTMPAVAASAETGRCPPVTPDADGLTAGMLLKPAGDGDAAVAGHGQWVVYLECKRPPVASESSDEEAPTDLVRICFGPPGAGLVEWRITPDGEPELRQPGAVSSPRSPVAAPRVTRSIQADRWLIWAPVPAAAIEPDGRVRLGIVRERQRPDGSIERTAWPRALAPWQATSAVGRLAVDLTRWDPESSP